MTLSLKLSFITTTHVHPPIPRSSFGHYSFICRVVYGHRGSFLALFTADFVPARNAGHVSVLCPLYIRDCCRWRPFYKSPSRVVSIAWKEGKQGWGEWGWRSAGFERAALYPNDMCGSYGSVMFLANRLRTGCVFLLYKVETAASDKSD